MGGGVKFTAGKKSAKINVYNHLSVWEGSEDSQQTLLPGAYCERGKKYGVHRDCCFLALERTCRYLC